MGRKIFSFRYVATILLTIGVIVLGALNAQQKRLYSPPDDGASWVQGAAGIQARVVVEDGAADKAGIKPGDVLHAINGEPIRNDRHVTQILYELTSWQRATYTVVRNEKEIQTTVVLRNISKLSAASISSSAFSSFSNAAGLTTPCIFTLCA
jgi:S1-C subfamily serine protease